MKAPMMSWQSPSNPMTPIDEGEMPWYETVTPRAFGFPDHGELIADSYRLGRAELMPHRINLKNGEQEQRGPFDAVPARSV